MQFGGRWVHGPVEYPGVFRAVRRVLVPVVMTPLVDSGELRARCWPCHRKSGGTVTLHPVEVAALRGLGLLGDAWRTIAEINEGVDDRGMS